VTTNATVRPSGDTWASLTKRMRVRSAGTMPRGVVIALASYGGTATRSTGTRGYSDSPSP